jgi:hypothetical protein
MNDFNSYEPVEFGKLDSNFFFWNQTDKYLADSAAFEIENSYETIRTQSKDQVDLEIQNADKGDVEVVRIIQKARAQNQRRFDSLLSLLRNDTLIPAKFIGYKMFHSLRGKNSFGAKVLEQKMFYFDSSLKILKTLDWKAQP